MPGVGKDHPLVQDRVVPGGIEDAQSDVLVDDDHRLLVDGKALIEFVGQRRRGGEFADDLEIGLVERE